MKSIASILFSVVLATLQQAPQGPAAGGIDGLVIDAGNGSPIKNVTVLLRVTGTPAYRVAKTDESGRFSFNKLPPGDARLAFSLDGYVGRTFEQIPINGRQERQVVLTRVTSVAGRVYDTNRQPAVGVEVQLLHDAYNGVHQRLLGPAPG